MTRWDWAAPPRELEAWPLPYEQIALSGWRLCLTRGAEVWLYPDLREASSPTPVTLPEWRGPCEALALSADGTLLALCSEAQGIQVVTVPGLATRQHLEDRLRIRACSLNDEVLVASSGGGKEGIGQLHAWDLRSGERIGQTPFPGGPDVLLLPDGRFLAGGNSAFVGVVAPGPDGLDATAFLDDGQGALREWGGAGVERPKAHAGEVRAIAHHADRLFTAAEAGTRGELRVWNLTTLELEQTVPLRSPPCRLLARPDGVVALLDDGSLLALRWRN